MPRCTHQGKKLYQVLERQIVAMSDNKKGKARISESSSSETMEGHDSLGRVEMVRDPSPPPPSFFDVGGLLGHFTMMETLFSH